MNSKTLSQSKTNTADKKSAIHFNIDTFKYKTAIETRFADFDMMGHVNNAVYFTYLEIARTKYWKQAIGWDWEKTGVVIAQAELDYILPVFLKDQISIYVRTSRIGRSSFDLEYLIVKQQGNTEQVCASGKSVCVAFDYQQQQATAVPADERLKMETFEQLSPAD